MIINKRVLFEKCIETYIQNNKVSPKVQFIIDNIEYDEMEIQVVFEYKHHWISCSLIGITLEKEHNFSLTIDDVFSSIMETDLFISCYRDYILNNL